MSLYRLTIHSKGSWAATISGLAEAELQESIRRIEKARIDSDGDPLACFSIEVASGAVTRIYGSEIAGFDYHEEA